MPGRRPCPCPDKQHFTAAFVAHQNKKRIRARTGRLLRVVLCPCGQWRLVRKPGRKPSSERVQRVRPWRVA